MAAGGARKVTDAARASYERLSAQLPGENPACHLTVAGGLVMTLEEYLGTRIVELVVHSDDLAASVGLAFGPPSPDVCTAAIGVLVDAARARHGDLPVLRALARRERDPAQALRVL